MKWTISKIANKNKTIQHNSNRINQNSTSWAPCKAAMTPSDTWQRQMTYIPAPLEKCYTANAWTQKDVDLNARSRHTRTGLRWLSNLSRQWYDWQVTHTVLLIWRTPFIKMQVNVNTRGSSLWPLKQDTSSSGSIWMRDKRNFSRNCSCVRISFVEEHEKRVTVLTIIVVTITVLFSIPDVSFGSKAWSWIRTNLSASFQ